MSFCKIGDFTCVEPALLISSFRVQRCEDAFLRRAELVVSPIPFVAYCQTCQQEYRPELNLEYACPECQAALHDIRSGRELRIERVTWLNDLESGDAAVAGTV